MSCVMLSRCIYAYLSPTATSNAIRHQFRPLLRNFRPLPHFLHHTQPTSQLQLQQQHRSSHTSSNRTSSSMSKIGMQSHAQVAIIGGGIAGLSAASRLAALNVTSTVFDMGIRNLGGRACSRVISNTDFRFNHGAQFIALHQGDNMTSVEEFANQVREWQRKGYIEMWDGVMLGLTPASPQLHHNTGHAFCGMVDTDSMYVGVPTMGSLATHIASDLKSTGLCAVKMDHKVTSLTLGKKERGKQVWKVEGVPRSASAAVPACFGEFDAVIVADALACFPDSAGFVQIKMAVGDESTPSEKEPVEPSSLLPSVMNVVHMVQNRVKHDAVFTLMVAFEGAVDRRLVPFDAAALGHGTRLSDLVYNNTSDVSGFENDGAAETTCPSSSFQFVARDSTQKSSDSSSTTSECWVAITTPERSQKLLEKWPLHTGKTYNPQTHEYREAVSKELLTELLDTLGKRSVRGRESTITLPPVVYHHAQRWGRGFVAKDGALPVDYFGCDAAGFAVCGDFCAGSRGKDGNNASTTTGTTTPIENAWMSGMRAAEGVAAWLK